MKKKEDTEDQFVCEAGEKVTFTLTPNSTDFIATVAFKPTSNSVPDFQDNKLSFRVGSSQEFSSASELLALITYEFNGSGGSYDVRITGSKGGAFKRHISQDASFNNRLERPYRFFA